MYAAFMAVYAGGGDDCLCMLPLAATRCNDKATSTNEPSVMRFKERQRCPDRAASATRRNEESARWNEQRRRAETRRRAFLRGEKWATSRRTSFEFYIYIVCWFSHHFEGSGKTPSLTKKIAILLEGVSSYSRLLTCPACY